MPNPSSGKTALITGASVGIGRDLAELLAADGNSLILVARNQSQLESLAEQLRSIHRVRVDVIAQDLSIAGAAQTIFDAVAGKSLKVDYLINNAGFGTHGLFAQADLASQISMLQVNIVALTHLTGLFLPSMIANKSGRIMNVASTAAYLPGPLMAVYYASKAYVLSFSEALDAELADSGVTVTTLCPGSTLTEFQKRAGITQSKLFGSGAMTSIEVARQGYAAMLAGKRTLITGLKNKFLIASTRFVSRKMSAAVAMKLNRNR